MEPIKKEQPKSKIPSYEHLKKDADLFWLKHAEKYEAGGSINYELLNHIVYAFYWFEFGRRKKWYEAGKRAFDFTTTAIILFLLSPIIILSAIAVKTTSSGPVFFRQVRIGRYGQPFRIFKFRTMCTNADRMVLFVENQSVGGLFKNFRDPRITPVGRFLRRWSIDELPQLWNVLVGDMSLVGPRPLIPEDSATTPEEYLLRFAVKPGLTGLWQVVARESLDGRFKIRLDYEYARSRSWWMDMKILFKTVPVVISGRGAK